MRVRAADRLIAGTILLIFLGLTVCSQSLPDQAGHSIAAQDSLARQLLRDCGELRDKGDYTASINAGLESLRISQKTGNTRDAARAYEQVAQVYQHLGEDKANPVLIDQGIEYARDAYEICHGIPDPGGEVECRNNQGIIYRSMALVGKTGYYDSALWYYESGLQTMKESGQGKEHAGTLYNNISQVYSEYKQDFPTALHYLQLAVESNKQIHNNRKLSYNYGNIAHVYAMLGDKKRSLEYAYLTLDLSRQLGMATRLQNAYQQLYDSYLTFKMPDSALHYFVLYDQIRDSLASVATTKQVAEMQTKYETEKNKSVIRELDSSNRAQKKDIVLLTAGIIALILFLLEQFLLLRRVQRQKRLITEQSSQLQLMMKELHHRVKNNLQIVSSLLSLQSYRMQDADAQEAIRLSQQRVQAMSFIHQRLYAGGDTRLVDMHEYLTELAGSLMMAYGYSKETMELRVKVSQKWLDVDRALPLGLIANEIITNALKYAYREVAHPSLQIDLIENKDHILLSIRDNGCQWDKKIWTDKGGSFGKQLIATLCDQLNARQELTTGGGSVFTFTIPREKAA
jgi:two-component sensor histidine kinase